MPKTLKLYQHVPKTSEAEAVGKILKKIKRGSPEFKFLVYNDSKEIIFKNEENNQPGLEADRMMTPRLREKLALLSLHVKHEYAGKIKLRVTESWDENGEHNPNSTHYEGRAADITTSDLDSTKLGRLAQLAVDAGFDWVYYENAAHVHVSVKKEVYRFQNVPIEVTELFSSIVSVYNNSSTKKRII